MRAVFIGASATTQATARMLLQRGHEVVIIDSDSSRNRQDAACQTPCRSKRLLPLSLIFDHIDHKGFYRTVKGIGIGQAPTIIFGLVGRLWGKPRLLIIR